jgi:uncharacterized phage protein (TIGR01671 family)
MREIKFRVWDARLKKMFRADSLMWKEDGLWAKCNNQRKAFKQFIINCNSNSKFLMQYTGLKDKNGKEIYEGDILRNKYGLTVEVHYTEGYFCYGNSITPDMAIMTIQQSNDCEVIGNIYENPELLKKGQENGT